MVLRFGMYKCEPLNGPVPTIDTIMPAFERHGYAPVFRRAVDAQAELLGLDSDRISGEAQHESEDAYLTRRSEIDAGELFTNGKYIVAVTFSRHRDRIEYRTTHQGVEEVAGPHAFRIQLAYIGQRGVEEEVAALVDALADCFAADFSPLHFKSLRFNELKVESQVGSPTAPSDEEQRAATILSDPAVRRLAIAVKSSGGLLRPDVERQLEDKDKTRVEEILASLEKADITRTHLVVICRKTQAQLNRVPSRDVLRRLSDDGVRCACGRRLADERIEDAVSITETGQGLIDGSRWMVIRLVDELLRVGVPLGHILVEQTVGGDEMDCFAAISGELVFFELKDKVFSLGNAYSFGAKVGIVQPEHSVIVTTEYVGNDAKEHFERAAAAGQSRRSVRFRSESEGDRIRYVEGIDTLPQALESLSEEIYVRDAARIISSIQTIASINPDQMLSALSARDLRTTMRG